MRETGRTAFNRYIRKVRSAPLLLMLVLALVIAACGGDGAEESPEAEGPSDTDSEEPDDDADDADDADDDNDVITVKVGIIGPLTGGGSALGTRSVQGAELALQQSNDDGGLETDNGRVMFEWVTADNQTDVSEAVTQIRRLIDVEDADAIVGGTLSDITLAMMEIAEDLQTPMIIPGAISPAIPQTIEEQGYDYVFMSAPTAQDRATADADAVFETVDPQRVFAVSQETAWGVPMFEAFSERLEEQSSDVEIRSEFVDPGNTDYGAVIGNLRNFDPDLIYAALVGPEMFSFMEQLRSRGIDATVFGASSDPASTSFIDELDDLANGVMGNLVWVPTDGDELITRFTDDYRAEHGQTPADVEAQAYDGALMLMAAVQAVGGGERDEIAAGLLDVDVVGVRGPQRYEPNDHTTRNLSFVIAQIQDGEHVIIWPSDSAEGEPEL